MNSHQLIKAILPLCALCVQPLLAQETPQPKTPTLDYSGSPTRVLESAEPTKGWMRYSDDVTKASWHAPSKPKKFPSKGGDYAAMYESRKDGLVYHLTIVETETMFQGSPTRFFDGMDSGLFRSLQRANIKIAPKPIAKLRFQGMWGRMMKIKTDRMSFAVVYFANDSHAFSLSVIGKDDHVEKAALSLVTTLKPAK